jgi:hypothetical protein
MTIGINKNGVHLFNPHSRGFDSKGFIGSQFDLHRYIFYIINESMDAKNGMWFSRYKEIAVTKILLSILAAR